MKIKNTIRDAFNGKFFPILLLLIMILTWGIQVSRYGFYLDDWIYLSAYDQGGFQGLLDYSINDSRPGLLAWVITFGFKLLGNNRLYWQLYTLFWRFVGGMFCWLLLRKLWRRDQQVATFSAILFMIFPFFKHQAFSIAYHLQWLQYALLLASFTFMIIAIQTENKSKRVLLLILSYLTSVIQLFSTEYFLTLELIRPLLIWFVLRDKCQNTRKRLIQTVKWALGYWLLLLLFGVLRFIVMPNITRDRNSLEWLRDFESPWQTIRYLFQLFLEYIVESVWGVWYRSIDPANLDFKLPIMQAALLISFAIFSLLLFIFSRSKAGESDREDETTGNEIIFVGIIATLLGFLPGIAIDKSPSTPFIYHDRFLIPSFWGISIATVAVISGWMKGFNRKVFLLSLLCGAAVFFQIKNSLYYRAAWENQQNFHWQLKWRVPDLKQGTAVLGDAIIASFMGGWADGAMLLEMYGKQNGHNPTPYWYFTVSEGDFRNEFEQKLPLGYANKIFDFQANYGDFIVITKPEWDRCLWFLEEFDQYNPYIQPHTKALIPLQNKDRILYASEYQMPVGIFGKDYQHDWCYYYENAARQLDTHGYANAIALYRESVKQNLAFKNPVEMTPFIRAAALTGEWELAAEITQKAAAAEPHITWEYFSKVWEVLLLNTKESAKREAAYQKILPVISPQN